ncbi:MAG TPA: hypothetical protein VGB68_12650 [Pyrinomonadaceae bacterium]|jgi:hypothetical protein
MKHFLNVTIVLLFSLILAGCAEKQPTNATIYQVKLSPKIQGAEEKVFTKEVTTGFEDNPQPLKITLTSFLNDEACWKTAEIKVDRNGGDENVVVSITNHDIVPPCALDMESASDQRFDTVSINTSFKYGLLGSGGKGAVFIRSDGNPAVTR